MLIAITGGIGSGKSVVSRMLSAMGYEVYDCDSRARMIVGDSREILSEIAARISADVVGEDWSLDRRALASIVFADSVKLGILNEITHGAVRRDLASWRASHEACGRLLFVETAILYQSGLDKMVDRVWEVTAPMETRIMRVMSRDGIDRGGVESRIASQNCAGFMPHHDVKEIVNDGKTPVLSRVLDLLAEAEHAG